MGQMEAMGLKGDMKEDVEENEGDNKPKLDRRVYSFEIMQGKVEQVKEAAKDRDFPTLEEYDYQNDKTTPNLNMNLRSVVWQRCSGLEELDQESSFFRATIGKSTLVVATTDVAVNQWKKQFEHWTTINDNGEKRVIMFSREHKRAWDTSKAVIVIASYHMLGHGGQREKEAEKIMQLIRKHEWGLIILDEVHVAAAKTFRRCVSETYSRCKLGLTATLVREDKMVDDLHYLVGPKLYEANWLDLQVKCRMDPLFYKDTSSEVLLSLIFCFFPLFCSMFSRLGQKQFNVCEYLIRYHEARGDKILVFSDNRFTLETYARTLLNKSVEGVIIQISSHFAARRQEAQRLGRILRPKPVSSSRFNAFFYTLVSSDTTEVKYATKRQRFLVDQGYAYRIVRDEDLIGTDPKKHGLQLSTPAKKASILAKIRAADEMVALEEEEEVGLDRTKQTRRRCRRGEGSDGDLSDATCDEELEMPLICQGAQGCCVGLSAINENSMIYLSSFAIRWHIDQIMRQEARPVSLLKAVEDLWSARVATRTLCHGTGQQDPFMQQLPQHGVDRPDEVSRPCPAEHFNDSGVITMSTCPQERPESLLSTPTAICRERVANCHSHQLTRISSSPLLFSIPSAHCAFRYSDHVLISNTCGTAQIASRLRLRMMVSSPAGRATDANKVDHFCADRRKRGYHVSAVCGRALGGLGSERQIHVSRTCARWADAAQLVGGRAAGAKLNPLFFFALGAELLFFEMQHSVDETDIGGGEMRLRFGFLFRLAPKTDTRSIMIRLTLDQTIFASVFNVVMFSAVQALDGTPEKIPATLDREWWPAMKANWQLWLPANFINFGFVPLRFQVLFANGVALIWNTYLSMAAHR
eukprot:jgi/Bigna1/88846/estExt_fgenesh1_pg.C_390061